MQTYSTAFARKPSTREDMDSLIAWGKHERFGNRGYFIAQEITLTETDWNDLMENMLADRDWLQEYNKVARDQYGLGGLETLVPCLLVKNEANGETLVIDSQGYNYPRYIGMHNAE